MTEIMSQKERDRVTKSERERDACIKKVAKCGIYCHVTLRVGNLINIETIVSNCGVDQNPRRSVSDTVLLRLIKTYSID